MAEQEQDHSTENVLNVVQLVFLNTVFMVALTLVCRHFEASWLWALGVGWVGAPFVTLAVAVLYSVLASLRVARAAGHGNAGAFATSIAAWDADCAAEIEEALAHMSTMDRSQPAPTGAKDTAAVWDRHASDDRADAERAHSDRSARI